MPRPMRLASVAILFALACDSAKEEKPARGAPELPPIAEHPPEIQAPASPTPAPSQQGKPPPLVHRHADEVVFEEKLVRIVSDVDLSRGEWAQAAARLETAYRGTAKIHGVAVEGAFAEPFTAHLLSAESLEAERPGANLEALGTRDIYAKADVMLNPGFSDGALLHECTHILHSRMATGHLGHYLEEGTAQELQRLYDAEHSQDKERYIAGMRGETPFLATVTTGEARPLLEQTVWDKKDINRTESLGCLFVEFLRTKVGGSGRTDYIARISRMLRSMPPKLKLADAGWRDAYVERLDREFGPGTEGAFLGYLQNTQGHPDQRLAGTVFAPWLADAHVQRDVRRRLSPP